MSRILTGDRPSGRLHLGHYVGSLQNRVALQSEHEQFIMIADTQALTDNYENPHKVRQSVLDIAKDYYCAGIDFQKSTVFVQSAIPELAELTIYFLNLVSLARLERNPTVKNEIIQKGFSDSIPVGFFCYPVSQAADITAFKAELVPVGDDQLPMIEQANEIVRKFNRIYQTECLIEAKPLLSTTSRLVGLDGKAKASKSLGNAIYLVEQPEELKRKVFSMFTDPNHLKVSDPGKVEGNAVFAYLDAFHPHKNEILELKERYRMGGLGDMTIKKLLLEVLESMIAPMRSKEQAIHPSDLMEELRKGTLKAREQAANTLDQVKKAIGIIHW